MDFNFNEVPKFEEPILGQTCFYIPIINSPAYGVCFGGNIDTLLENTNNPLISNLVKSHPNISSYVKTIPLVRIALIGLEKGEEISFPGELFCSDVPYPLTQEEESSQNLSNLLSKVVMDYFVQRASGDQRQNSFSLTHELLPEELSLFRRFSLYGNLN